VRFGVKSAWHWWQAVNQSLHVLKKKDEAAHPRSRPAQFAHDASSKVATEATRRLAGKRCAVL
jgi:hypothetical protein